MPISATLGRLIPVPARRNGENAILFSTSLAALHGRLYQDPLAVLVLRCGLGVRIANGNFRGSDSMPRSILVPLRRTPRLGDTRRGDEFDFVVDIDDSLAASALRYKGLLICPR